MSLNGCVQAGEEPNADSRRRKVNSKKTTALFAGCENNTKPYWEILIINHLGKHRERNTSTREIATQDRGRCSHKYTEE